MTNDDALKELRPQWWIRSKLAKAAADTFPKEPKSPAEKAAKDFLQKYAKHIHDLIEPANPNRGNKKSSNGDRLSYSNALEWSLRDAFEENAELNCVWHPRMTVGTKPKYLDLLLENGDFRVAIEVKGSNEFDDVAAAMMEFFLAVKAKATIGTSNAKSMAANTRFALICMCGKSDNWFDKIAATLFPNEKEQAKLLTLFSEKYAITIAKMSALENKKRIDKMLESESKNIANNVLATFEWIFEHLVPSNVIKKPAMIRKLQP